MAYRKFTVDNTTCSRRFHLATDDEGELLPRVEVRCQFCNVVVFSDENHARVKLLREENLVKTSQLSELILSECHFKDTLSEKTIPQALAKKPKKDTPHP